MKQANKNLSKEEIRAKRQAHDPNLKKKKDKEAKDKKGELARSLGPLQSSPVARSCSGIQGEPGRHGTGSWRHALSGSGARTWPASQLRQLCRAVSRA